MKLKSIEAMARDAGYNETGKEAYRKAAMAWLRRLAKELNLIKTDYQVRFNPGGIAVAGDATLHHERFYLTINEFGVMWRTCKGQRDYTGGPNQWFGRYGYSDSEADLIESIKKVISPS